MQRQTYAHLRQQSIRMDSRYFHRLAPLALLSISVCMVAKAQQATSSTQSAAATTQAAPGAQDDLATKANDPTAALKQLQVLNSYNSSYYGTPGEGNEFSLRPVLPKKIHGINTITRPTFALQSTPNGRTGLGDTILLSVAIFEVAPKIKVGAGPLLIAPTASNRFAGQGKWQLGPSIVVIDARMKGLLLGVLEQNPISFAGQSKRSDVNQSLLQPVIVKTLEKGYFIRIDPTLSFDWTHGGTATVPVNAAIGRLFKWGGQSINAYVQPEWNVRRPAYVGAVAPHFTMRGSFTFLFP